MKTAVKILIVVIVLANVVYYWPPARLLTLMLIGRSQCSFKQTLRSYDNTRKRLSDFDRYRRACRIVEHDRAGFELWETPKGRFWMPHNGTFLPYVLAEDEGNVYTNGGRGIRAGDVVLDCGAHVGAFTRRALRAGASLVVAVEPGPLNLECLRRNFAEEITAGHVQICPKALWDRDDALTLRFDEKYSALSTLLADRVVHGRTVEVPVITIDHLVADFALSRVDFIKMDIEGAEEKALLGARATLLKHKPGLALAAEHNLADAARLPAVVRSIHPAYRMECGPCEDHIGWVRPETLYFF